MNAPRYTTIEEANKMRTDLRAALDEGLRLTVRVAALESSLSGLLGVMNTDDDGDWFICKEAAPSVRNAEALVYGTDPGDA